MSTARTQRRLAAILAADVVGYSRLMGQDEAGTLVALKAARAELIDPKVVEHTGRVFKATGDGLLAEFASVVNAVSCAIEIQRGMKDRRGDLPDERAIQLRIGINLGDIIVEDGDVFGDGVNVAARIENIAPPGGVAISGTVRDHLGTRLDLHFEDIGEQMLKNIDRPVRVYVIGGGTRSGTSYPKLPDKPSIAVLPFENLSGDREQEYFADGMVEEIITALSRFRQLFVIARNSSFTYKGRVVDVKQVGRELGVRYVLEGSVRKAGNKVRITGQLIDTSTAEHLWADRFDGGLEDIFDLQDQVTASVVGAILPRLQQAEIERSKRKPTESLDAYDYYLRGMASLIQWTKDANNEALLLFQRAIEFDPNFASAYAMAARCYSQRMTSGWMSDRAREIAETSRLARRAAELGTDDAVALSTAGFALAYVSGEFEEGNAMIDRALVLNANLAWAWYFSGWGKIWLGEPEIAITHLARALRLSPHDPHAFNMKSATAFAHFIAGRYAEAFSWAESALLERPDHSSALRVFAASCGMLGLSERGAKAIARLRELDPRLRLSNLRDITPLGLEHFASLSEGLRKAGLPE
jgi:TolB-like protein/class 3 adenylate cyclase/Tfp pilus assembly protein PilF